MFRPNFLVWTYSTSICRDIHEILLITVNFIVLSVVIVVDIIVLVLLWKKKVVSTTSNLIYLKNYEEMNVLLQVVLFQKRMLQNLNSFWSELQFIIMVSY